MLVYPEEIESKLEIGKIRREIQLFCQTEAAKSRASEVKLITDRKFLANVLAQTQEMLELLTGEESYPSARFEDISESLKKIIADGTFLPSDKLANFKDGLVAIYEWSQYLKKRSQSFPSLSKLVLGFVADKELITLIDTRIDERGEVRENASPTLMAIRKKRYGVERQVRKVIQQILDRSKKDDYTEDDGAVTIRGGRLVIPIKAEYKRKLPGFVHDESSSGQTVFMEPTEVLDLNNQVTELQYEEQREIIKILTEVASAIRSRLKDLQQGSVFLTKVDFLHAKAQFARAYEASIPQLSEKAVLKVIEGKHPILWKKNREAGKEVVPLSIELTPDNRMVLISGPNAGGKSVALKTVGILQYLFQCGFPVPANPDSQFGVFRNIFVDIGDSQSLENDLSTYSSHLKAMNFFMKFSDKQTLLLIDEFGTGTEPQFGGAIAEAILDKLNQTKARGIITTHYGNLKKLAEETPGIINAAMRYDVSKLEPLFQLEIGKPGSSFAFEIARKMGISKELLNEARINVGEDQVDYNKLLAELDSERAAMKREKDQMVKQRQDLKKLSGDYEELRHFNQEERKRIIKEAEKEAFAILKSANKEIENTIRTIKESKADKQATRKAREELEGKTEQLGKNLSTKQTLPEPKSQPAKIAVGDKVSIFNQNTVGEVVAIKGKQVQVVFGALKSYVDLAKLRKISGREAKKINREIKQGVDITQRRANFSNEIDVRGKRAEEVLPVIDKMLDDALMLGISELRVLHGKGYGILKDVIRNHLQRDAHVLSFEDEHVERGGSGITKITLK